MIITTLNLEKREEIELLEAEFQSQISKLENQEKEMIENMNFSKIQLQDMQKVLQNEIFKREELEDELLRRGSGYEEEVSMRLQFESRLNQMYAKMRDLQTKIELMQESLNEMQEDVNTRTESLQKERTKNVQLTKIRTEVEQEMKKTEEKYKQTENINTNLEKRVTECYEQIEALSVNLSNLNSEHNEALNLLAQKKIEGDDLKFALELAKGKISKIEAVILENEAEKRINLKRIRDLEISYSEESENNKHYQQEFVRIKESDKVNGSELVKYKARSEEQEKVILELEKERNSLIIRLESSIRDAEEYRASLKDIQQKLEEMNKGRRIVEETNEFLKNRLEERTKEVKDLRIQSASLKDDQDRAKAKEIELEIEINELRIKLQSVQKQFETTKVTLQEKVDNLYEILESEKKIRENWIYRYEEEQKVHSHSTKELLASNDQLNEAKIKISNLTALLEESNFQKNKMTESHKQDIEEILLLRFQNEDYLRKNRTLQQLLDNIDNEYSLREQETKKEFELIKENLQQQNNCAIMKIEDIWVQARKNFETVIEIKSENDKIVRKMQGVEK